jgi:hypothetical protein
VTPRFAPASPLRLECEAFLGAIRASDDSLADARRAAATVNVLQTLDASESAEEPLEADAPMATVLRLPAPPPAEQAASADDALR